MIRFHILTIFPKIFDSYLDESLMRRARENRIVSVTVHDIRDAAENRHNKVDDRPFGGGPGMVLQVGPIWRTLKKIRTAPRKRRRIVLFSTRGKPFTAKTAQRLAKYDEIVLICGRYEGVDERVAKHIADEEVSLGPYVLSGGELPALIVTEAVARFRPGFLGKHESLEEQKGSYPVYTRPPVFSPKKGVRWSIPKVLASGDHAKIEAWRRQN